MKIAIFGASGQTGRLLVQQALAAGHEVTAFVRDPARFPIQHGRLRLVQGDVKDAGAVDAAVAGQGAVLSALAPAKPDFDAMTLGARHVLAAMARHGVRRLVTLTGAGVPDPNDRPTPLNRVISFLLRRISPAVLADAERHVAQVRASDTDWTIVRVGALNNRPQTGTVRVGWVGINTGPFVSRAAAAAFMLAQLADPANVRRAPMISS